ncbi:tetratricopeptide repeat protein [Nonomuraea phyllanthi]|nr:tetratricopeptide repeat protein [Nonomuraea phyllanthi]
MRRDPHRHASVLPPWPTTGPGPTRTVRHRFPAGGASLGSGEDPVSSPVLQYGGIGRDGEDARFHGHRWEVRGLVGVCDRDGGTSTVTLEIGFLGPWEIRVDGLPVRLTGRRRIAVLTRLALNAGRPVTSQQLLADVWAESPAATAAKQLQIVVSKLRRALEPYVGGEVIGTVAGGYRLDLPHDRVDAHRFTRLARQAQLARDQGDTAGAAELFRQALALWRGRALAELAEPWAQIESSRLEEQRLAAVEDHFDLRLAAGDHHAVVPELSTHVLAQPLRERPRAQLMLALYRAARLSEALAVYQDIREVMVAELGIEPGAQLRRLQHAILTGDPALDLTSPAQQSRLSRPVAPAELPADTHAFTARQAEITWMREVVLAESTPGAPTVAVIDGPGGLGKSALAVHVAREVASRFSDGVVYVNLHGATPGLQPLSVIEALGQLLRQLGLDGNAVPADLDGALARYRSLTATSDLLMILDNAYDALQVRPLIPAGSGCRVLITSRDMLATLDNARHLHLAGFGDRDATALLARIAGPARVQAEPAVAAKIAELCGGYPLAIRIAAARLAARPHWTLSDLADRLADTARRLDTLQYADLAVRTSIAVSHRHLREEPSGQDAAQALTLLGLLDTPTHTPAATAALAGWPESRAEAALERLLDARLLEPAGRSRYRFHDLIRLYAREQAMAHLPAPERAAALRRGLHHYLATANTATLILHLPAPPVYPSDEPGLALADAREASGWVVDERDNLLAAAHQAAESADPGTAIGLSIGLHWPFNYRGWLTHLIDVHRGAIDIAARCGDPAGQAQVLSFLGWAYRDQGNYELAVSHLEQALRCYDRAGLPLRKIGSYNNLGIVHTLMGRFDLAIGHLERALAIAEETGKRYDQAAVRNNRAHVLFRQGRHDEAIAEAEVVVDMWGGLSTLYGKGTAHSTLADAYRHAGMLTEAAEQYRAGLTFLREAGYRIGCAVSAWHYGDTLHALGRHAEAGESWRESASLLLDARLLTRKEVDELLAQPVPEMPPPLRNML